MARIYANENFPLPAVLALRRLGHDTLTTADSGKSDQAIPDDEVLAFATAESRIVATMNRLHFIRLHQVNPDHGGIVVCTFDPDFEALAQRIHKAMENQPHMAGQLIRINRPS
jgi:hypothetical protein